MTDLRPLQTRRWRWCKFLELLFYVLLSAALASYAIDAVQKFRRLRIDEGASLPRLAAWLAWISVAWYIGWNAAMYAYAAFCKWALTRVVLGPGSTETRRLMKALVDVSRMRDTKRLNEAALPYVAIAIALLFVLVRDWRLLFPLGWSVSVLWWLRIRLTRLPAVVLLGTSDAESVARFAAYREQTRPLRVICLLDLDVNQTNVASGVLALDCLRTNNTDDWWIVITQLIDRSPIVVVGGAAETDGVIREAEYLRTSDAFYKTIFISGPEGDCPLLQRIGLGRQSTDPLPCIVEDDEVLPMVIHMLALADLPTRSRNAVRIRDHLRAASLIAQLQRQTAWFRFR